MILNWSCCHQLGKCILTGEELPHDQCRWEGPCKRAQPKEEMGVERGDSGPGMPIWCDGV